MLWFADWSGPQLYNHRVGRTARAGRSGVAISLVNQYEWEWFVQIENDIGRQHMPFVWWSIVKGVSQKLKFFFGCVSGKKISQFPCQKEEVLLFMERITEAQRIARVVMIFFFFLIVFIFNNLWRLRVLVPIIGLGYTCPSPCLVVWFMLRSMDYSKPPSVSMDMPRSLMHACTHYVRRIYIYIYITEKGFLKF